MPSAGRRDLACVVTITTAHIYYQRHGELQSISTVAVATFSLLLLEQRGNVTANRCSRQSEGMLRILIKRAADIHINIQHLIYLAWPLLCFALGKVTDYQMWTY